MHRCPDSWTFHSSLKAFLKLFKFLIEFKVFSRVIKTLLESSVTLLLLLCTEEDLFVIVLEEPVVGFNKAVVAG